MVLVNEETEVGKEAAVRAASEPITPTDRVTLGNGIVLKVKEVPPLLIKRAMAQVKKPEVPEVLIESKGRIEENPDDPRYLAAMAKYDEDTNDAALNVMLLVGTSVLSVPEGIDRPEDNGWIETFEAVGMIVNASSIPARYLSWVQMVACGTVSDLFKIGEAVGRASGLREEDIADAIETFRGNQGRGADNGVPSPNRDIDRDPIPTIGTGNDPRD